MTKPYNRLWYVAEEDMARYAKGEKVCYEHDNPNCKICPTCKNSQLCSQCDKEINAHNYPQSLECLEKSNHSENSYRQFESAIAQICMSNLCMKELKLDGKIIYQRDMDKQ